MVGRRQGSSLHRFHFFDGIFLGHWYPEGASRQKHGIEKVRPFVCLYHNHTHPSPRVQKVKLR